MTSKVLALSGGVGGAKLALGLSRVLSPDQLTVVCNTGDDFDHLGLRICPDLDTVTYTLSGQSNQQQGWGLADESWQVMARLRELEGEDWFNLGDKDLATHLLRTGRLARGDTLTAVTAQLAAALGIRQRILPMTDDPVATRVHTTEGTLAFQHYFVREQCRPAVTGFEFAGIERARPQRDFMALLADEDLSAVILCPSNPFVSIDPILNVPGVRSALSACPAPVIAVSPIVGGQAIKGPSAKMMAELGIDCSCYEVAARYGDFLDGYIIDTVDSHLEAAIAATGPTCAVTRTVMASLADKTGLAEHCLAMAAALRS